MIRIQKFAPKILWSEAFIRNVMLNLITIADNLLTINM